MAIEVPPPETLADSVVAAARTRPSGWIVSLALLAVSITFAVAGHLTLKAAMDQIGRIGAQEVGAPGETIARAAREVRLWVGLALFGISAVFWLVVLSRVPLSIAYPSVGASYILIVVFARLFLGEHVPLLRWLGVVVIAIGVAVVGMTFQRASGT